MNDKVTNGRKEMGNTYRISNHISPRRQHNRTQSRLLSDLLNRLLHRNHSSITSTLAKHCFTQLLPIITTKHTSSHIRMNAITTHHHTRSFLCPIRKFQHHIIFRRTLLLPLFQFLPKFHILPTHFLRQKSQNFSSMNRHIPRWRCENSMKYFSIYSFIPFSFPIPRSSSSTNFITTTPPQIHPDLLIRRRIPRRQCINFLAEKRVNIAKSTNCLRTEIDSCANFGEGGSGFVEGKCEGEIFVCAFVLVDAA